MTLPQSIAAFLVAGGLLTLTPGLDTALVLRTAASEGRRSALLAMAGIQFGCLAWGAAVALGLGLLLATSPVVYSALTWIGAAYLAWIGIGLLVRPRRTLTVGEGGPTPPTPTVWLRRGFLTNLLNPKIGVFYVSFLPQFVPDHYPAAPAVFGFAVLHVLLATLWLSALIVGMGRLRPILARPAVIGWLDRAAGVVFVGFGLRLALHQR